MSTIVLRRLRNEGSPAVTPQPLGVYCVWVSLRGSGVWVQVSLTEGASLGQFSEFTGEWWVWVSLGQFSEGQGV